ncbi:MAG TPA: hypothetical protein VG322_15060 [Candidatus Acidoferrales bacterium]|nr:hypothetical protein [Candidatus Acidoferrales bacterium]
MKNELTPRQQDEIASISQKLNSAGLELRELVNNNLYEGPLSEAVDHIRAAVSLVSEFLRQHKS